MKLYVAGKWEERSLIKDLMQTLESMGHTITLDWTMHDNTEMVKQFAIDDSSRLRGWLPPICRWSQATKGGICGG